MSRFAAAFIALCVLSMATSVRAGVIYVDANLATGANDGTSWANAYRGVAGLQSALAASVAGDEIWVADGRYRPGTTRGSVFALKNGVAIYGGFAGGEVTREQRNPAVNVAVLTGDLNSNDAAHPSGWGENAYHVVASIGPNDAAVLDGFTISHGWANGGGANQERGAGVLCLNGFPTLQNLVIVDNYASYAGGGLYVGHAGPVVSDCRLSNNSAGTSGGGAAFEFSACRVGRTWFLDNTAGRGAAIDVAADCELYVLNCVVARNNASGANGGGAAHIQGGSSVDLANCTIYANTANVTVGGVKSLASTVNVWNTIVYANSISSGQVTEAQQLAGVNYNVSYSCVQHGYFGAFAVDPDLMDGPGQDYRPFAGSPVIDAGNNLLAALEPFDITGSSRYYDDPDTKDTGSGDGAVVDIGAHEYQGGGQPDCPEITEHPSGVAGICAGEDLWLYAGASGGGVTGYQWRKDGVDIPGATSDTLALLDIANSDEGQYNLVVFDASCAPVESHFAHVVVCATDSNCDGAINSTDVSQFINRWFQDHAQGTFLADFDENGVVNSTDVSEFINTWFEETIAGHCVG